MAKVTVPIQELNSFDLPPVCVVTGSDVDVTFHKQRFTWTPPWVYLLILVPAGGLVLAAIVSLLVRRRVEGELPYSELGRSRFQLARVARPVSVLLLIVGCVGSSMLLVADSDGPLGNLGPPAFLLSVLLPIATYIGTRKWVVMATRISKTHVDLRVGSDHAAQAITAHLKAGGAGVPYGPDDASAPEVTALA